MNRGVRRPLQSRTSGPGRDLAAWLALALVVAGIVVLTTRGIGLGVRRVGAAARRPHPLDPPGYTFGSLPVPTSVPDETELPAPRVSSATTVPASASTSPTTVPASATTSPATVPTTSPTTVPASASTSPTRLAPPRRDHPAVGPPPRRAAHPVAPAPSAPVLAPALVSARWPGNFQYPDDVAATYAVETSGGVVSATAAWSGAAVLTIGVSCHGGALTSSGTTGLYVSAVGDPGTCSITISEPPGVAAVVSYFLVAHYPALERQRP